VANEVIQHIHTESFCHCVSGKEIQVICGTGFFMQHEDEVQTICLLKSKKMQDYQDIQDYHLSAPLAVCCYWASMMSPFHWEQQLSQTLLPLKKLTQFNM